MRRPSTASNPGKPSAVSILGISTAPEKNPQLSASGTSEDSPPGSTAVRCGFAYAISQAAGFLSSFPHCVQKRANARFQWPSGHRKATVAHCWQYATFEGCLSFAAGKSQAVFWRAVGQMFIFRPPSRNKQG